MRFVTVLVAMLFALGAAGASTYAQGRGNGQAKKTAVSAPKPKSTTQTATPKQTAKAETRAAKTVAKAETRAAKTTAKADARAAKAEAKTARKSNTLTIVTTDPTPATPTTHFVKNPKLEARLLTLLPGVTDINAASQGFKNWGQFVAAVHVSNNLGIAFADLKARMTGVTPGTLPGTTVQTTPMSLGQAIQSFKGTTTPPTTPTGTLSTTQISSEVKKAEDAANTDLRRSRDRS